MAKMADEIAQVLRAHGVSRIFGIPGGGSSLDLIDAADKAGIPFIVTRTEAAATIMAAVTGELSGKPGAVLVGVGPGASSATNGLAYASLERSPMALFIDGPAASLHQHFDQQAMYRPITLGTAQLVPETGTATLSALLTKATSAPEGPVMVEMTAADAASPATPFNAPSAPAEPLLDAAAIDAARTTIGTCRRPLMIVGLEARAHSDAVRAFADQIGAAVMTTYKAGGVVDRDHPGFIGPITGASGEMAIIEQADLVIGVGFDFIEFIPGVWPDTAPPVVMLNEALRANPRMPVMLSLTGPLDVLMEGVSPEQANSGWGEHALDPLKEIIQTIYQDDSAGFSCTDAVDVLIEILDHDTRITVDAGAHMFATIGKWPARQPFGILKSNGLSTMGYAVPAAIASALENPETPVVAVTGDGGMSMCIAELATAIEQNLNIKICVINDSALSLIDVKQQRQQRPSRGVRYPTHNYADIARAYGWQASIATSPDELKSALQTTGPSLIDIRIDPASYGEDLERLRG